MSLGLYKKIRIHHKEKRKKLISIFVSFFRRGKVVYIKIMGSQEKRIVICPFCQTKFYVWLSLLSERRKVRCSHCQNSWFQDPKDCESSKQDEGDSTPSLVAMRFIGSDSDKKNDLPPVPPLGKKEMFDEEDSFPKQKKRRFSFIAFLLPLVIFILSHRLLVQAFPVLERVYRILGLTPVKERESFEIRNTSWQQVMDQEIPSLMLVGELSNVSPQLKDAPSLQVVLRGTGSCRPADLASQVFGDEKVVGDDGTCVLERWPLAIGHNRLLPGQVVAFKSSHPLDEHYKIEKVQIDFSE